MKDRTKDKFENFFIFLSTIVIILGWIFLLLTELRYFYAPILYIVITISFLSILLYILKFKIYKFDVHRLDKTTCFTIFLVILFAAFNSIMFHETFFGGRDQGVYFNSSVYLANKHSLIMPRYLDSKPKLGESVSFPGYVNLMGDYTQPTFHFGYISWLASHYVVGGISGIKWSNFLPMVLGMISIYIIIKRLKNEKAGLIFVLLFGTSLPFVYIARQTLTEIFTLFLIFSGILGIMKFYETRNQIYLYSVLLAFGLALHTRLELLFIFPIAVVLIILFLFKKRAFPSLILLLIFISMIIHFVFYSLNIQPGYNHALKNVLYYFQKKPQSVEEINWIKSLSQDVDIKDLIALNLQKYIFLLFHTYGLLSYVLLGFLGILKLLINKKHKIYYIIPFIIILPTYYYLRNPQVSFDHPWFFRRFIFTVLPCSFLYSALLISSFKTRFRVLVMAILLLINISITFPFVFYIENNGLFATTKKISKLFNENDIIFYDIHSLNKEMTILADPLFFVFNRKTEYVSSYMAWNGQLNDKWINEDLSKYENVYLISSNPNDGWFTKYISKGNIKEMATFTFETPGISYKKINHLNNLYDSISIPTIIKYKESIMIYKLDL